ncbi:hypothetical protein JXA85_02530, partial [Candidatus Woesearchaeota archaeon]|nr:hypothetical protein [Candidatus Woesearchaeota archaeon]
MLAVRVAGSGASVGAPCDVLTVSESRPCLVEVKTCKEPVFYVRSHIREQLENLRRACFNHGGRAVLAVRFKNR